MIRPGTRRHAGRRPACGALLVAAVLAALAAGCSSPSGSTGTGTSRPTGPPSPPTSFGGGSSSSFTTANLGNELTYDFDNLRSGDAGLSPALSKLSLAWDDGGSGARALGAAVYAAPLVDRGLVVVAAENDVVYGIDARSGDVRWRFSLGQPVDAATLHRDSGLGGCGTVFPLGITGTPVIDPAKQEVFVAAEVLPPGASGPKDIEHVLAGASLQTGKVLFERRIDPPGAGSSYDVAAEQQRGALTLASGRVDVPFGGLYGDCGNYHGFLVSSPEGPGGALTTFQAGSGTARAIWATSGAVALANGELYVATGNGTPTPGGASFDDENAVIELSPALRQLASFAPTDWLALDRADADLGSAGPVVVPGTGLVFQAGKADAQGRSTGYLVDAAHLGGVGGQVFAGTACAGGGSVFGADAAATIIAGSRVTTYVYLACSGGTEALRVTAGAHPSFTRAWVAAAGGPNGPPIVAGGLVWAINNGANGAGDGANRLYGMDPSTGKVEITEQLDQVAHFAAPSAGDGMLFVPTASGVEAFAGPRGIPAPSATAVRIVEHGATLTAVVRPAPLGGTVTFSVSRTPFAGCRALVPTSTGSVSCTPSGGRLTDVTASYSGVGGYGSSSGSLAATPASGA